MARRRSGKKIDFVHWTGVQEQFAAQASGSAGVNVAVAAHESETLLRFRGNVLVYVDGAQPPGGLVQVALGMLLVPEGSGTVVTATPGTNPDSPWLWYEICAVGYEEMVTDVVDVPGLTSFRATIDSKAMRVIRNQEIQLVIHNTTLQTALSVNVVVNGRMLSGK